MAEKSKETSEKDAKPAKQGLFRLPSGEAPDAQKSALPSSIFAVMSVTELLEIRTRLDEHLPPRKLSDMDLEEEVLLQFARTKQLYSDVAEHAETPANQRAQVANSCTAILDQLIKMQARLYSAERVKALEQALIRTLKTLSVDAQEKFFEQYERNLSLQEIAAK